MIIRIHIYLLLMIAYMYAIGKLETFASMYIFVMLHELAHIIAAILLKFKVYEINFLPIGMNMKYDGKANNKKEILIYIAGPIGSFLLFLLLKNNVYKIMNIVICIFNLIPIKPFDGGKILDCIFKIFLSKKQIMKIEKANRKIIIILLTIASIYIFIETKEYYIVIFIIYLINIVKEESNYLQID